MPAIHVKKIDTESIESDQYCPQNTDELMKATQTIIYNNKNEIGRKEIELVWKTLNKIIDKVK